MDRKWLLFPAGLIVGTCYLSATLDKSFALDRPVHTAGVVLLLSGIAIVAQDAVVARVRRRLHQTATYEAIPLSDGSRRPGSPDPVPPWPRELPGSLLDTKSRVALSLLLLFGICGRVVIYQRNVSNIECAGSTALAIFVPVILAGFHAAREVNRPALPRWRPPVAPRALLDDTLNFIFCAGTRYILPALLLSASTSLAAWRGSSVQSTYICPTATSAAATSTQLQFLGFVVDCIVALVLYSLIDDRTAHTSDAIPEAKDNCRNNTLIGMAFIAAAAMIAVTGIGVYAAFPQHRLWLLAASSEYTRSLLVLSLVIPCTILCFLFSIRMYGVMSTVLVVSFCIAYTGVLRALGTKVSYNFPPRPTVELAIYFVVLTVALILYLVADSSTESHMRPRISLRPGRYQTILLAFIFLGLFFSGFDYRLVRGPIPIHPISRLIEIANSEHEQWGKQADRSKTLKQAVANYQERYSRAPPPGFDRWYEYATIRGSIVVDDFDNIEEDLFPFLALSPSELRERTAEIIAEKNGIGGVMIRNGQAQSFPDVVGTQNWIIEGVVSMITNFAEHLPDMDLALNMNEESRVAVPFDDIQEALAHGERLRSHRSPDNPKGFSPNRAITWHKIDEVPKTTSPRFRSTDLMPTFYSHGSIACPPTSRARRERLWNVGSFCTSCSAPHSMGAFVANWSISADPCHQPDLANLHGFHLSPSLLHPTHDLVPVFSQSRAPGFLDIRYPSPYNYLDRPQYSFDEKHPDLPFKTKENLLFWRGGTSEGTSAYSGTWKGMLRQRLVHLLNNDTHSQLILLPTGKDSYDFVKEDTNTIKSRLEITSDVRFVDKITHCEGSDCETQAREFGFGSAIDFRHHWRYKYLFDADGAGFSGRFIPFLRSNSVVFKTALFREWYEGRLIAWKHFVPVDLRLHDLFSSLAYFGGYGLKDNRVGKRRMEARDREAERIARESKVWAEKVLRKEDMEIYFFRLLLEWGRLTDERRAELGYKYKEGDDRGGKRKGSGRRDGEDAWRKELK